VSGSIEGTVVAVDGSTIDVAVELARAVRRALADAGLAPAPFAA
jgi:hypothetical protein